MHEKQQNLILVKAFFNASARIRGAVNKESNADTIQQLFRLLQERDYFAVLLIIPERPFIHPFFAHSDAIGMTARCPEVLMVDAAYNTNISKFPI